MYNGTINILFEFTINFTYALKSYSYMQPWTASLYFDLTFCQAGSIVVGHVSYLPDKWSMSGSNN